MVISSFDAALLILASPLQLHSVTYFFLTEVNIFSPQSPIVLLFPSDTLHQALPRYSFTGTQYLRSLKMAL